MTNTTINYNGTNYTVDYCDLKITSKTIRQYVKKNHPECKFSVTTKHYTSIIVSLMAAPFEVYTNEAKEIAELEGFHLDNNRSYGCAMRNAEGFRIEVYTDEAKAVLDDIEAFIHALNYDNSDHYTDYFDRGFYDYLNICTMGTPAPAQEETAVESAPAPVALPETPEEFSNDVYTVSVYLYTNELKKENFITDFRNVSLADFAKYVDNNYDAIADAIGGTPTYSYFVYKNGKSLVNGYTQNFTSNMLNRVANEHPDEYPAILAAISDPDNDPDPTEPTDKPDAPAFDTQIIAVSFDKTAASAPANKGAAETKAQKAANTIKTNAETLPINFICEKTFDSGEINLYFDDGGDLIAYFISTDGKCKVDRCENYTAEFMTLHGLTSETGEASPAASAPAQSPIDETAARRGHEAYSFSDYKAGSATAEYNAAVANVRAAADEIRGNVPEEYRGELDKLVNRYAVKLADWTNRKNRADTSCPSWFITGAANYPHKKHEKQMQKLDKLFKEYDTITALENRIKNFAYECKHRPIKAGDASALDKLRAKVEELTALQEQMKQSNAEARRQGKTAPYGAYSLSNNRQNLNRYADRLAALEKAKTAPAATADPIEGEGFRVVRNTEIMRLQFLFDSKPDEQIRTLLKSNGFKWAPSQKAWQRQLTPNAERAARTVIKAGGLL